jgi:acyl-coenzyme A thioesterase PaaI-like protein
VPSREERDPGVVRAGPFWDVLEGRCDAPPAAVLLGWRLVAVDPAAGTIEVSFTATERFLNPVGDVQGGFLAAMLDDTLGPALVRPLERVSGRPRLICRFSS